MIRILFVIPYSEMEQDIRQILRAFGGEEEIECRFALYAYNEIEEQFSFDWPCDIIIARGYAADYLSRMNLPCVIQKMTFNSIDIINAVYECRSRFHSRKIAVVGHPSLVLATETIRKIYDIPIEIYEDHGSGYFDDIFERALADGCDTVIAGRAPCARAEELGIQTCLAKTNRETLYRAITDAVYVLRSNRQKQTQLEILQKVMDNSEEGYLLFDAQGNLSMLNKYAEALFYDNKEELHGKNYQELLPELSSLIGKVYRNYHSINNELLKRGGKKYTTQIMPLLSGTSSAGVLIDCRDIDSLQEMEIQVRKRLASKGMVTHYRFEDIIHKSSVIERLIDTARQYASVDSNIIIEGQTGTGKELFAQSIHAASLRAKQPFVAVNCASIPENLLESEMFGYVPGAFTGASKEGKQGLFELAHNGTLFLDEISELPYSFQGKLLRALQEHEIRRIGDNRIIPVNVRIIAASNRRLIEMVREKTFRRDLFYRLSILPLSIPPLSARKEDIPLIFHLFIQKYADLFGKNLPIALTGIEKQLMEHDWFGNVRELRNVAERFMVQYKPSDNISELLGRCLEPDEVFVEENVKEQLTERERIEDALKRCKTKDEAAQLLGICRTTLWRRIRQYGLD